MKQVTSEVQLETMVTIRQVADFLHVSISTVRRWSDSGMLKSYRVGPRGDRRYQLDDVLSFVEESTYHLKASEAGKKIINRM